jgi:uncharacterized Zn-finger protein
LHSDTRPDHTAHGPHGNLRETVTSPARTHAQPPFPPKTRAAAYGQWLRYEPIRGSTAHEPATRCRFFQLPIHGVASGYRVTHHADDFPVYPPRGRTTSPSSRSRTPLASYTSVPRHYLTRTEASTPGQWAVASFPVLVLLLPDLPAPDEQTHPRVLGSSPTRTSRQTRGASPTTASPRLAPHRDPQLPRAPHGMPADQISG